MGLKRAGASLPEALKRVVDYRKSGLSLNHIVGCPLDCGYCVRHLFSNFEMKKPHLVVDDKAAIDTLLAHWAFAAHLTPIQIFNRATDPFLPGVKDHLFTCLQELDRRGLTNHVLIITRWRVEPNDVRLLEKLENLKLTILITWSGINDARIEPVDSGIAEESLRQLNLLAHRTKCILYWRPLVAGLNDTATHFDRAKELSELADATVFTGLFYREEVRRYLIETGVPDLYEEVARRKVLPEDVECRVIRAMEGVALFRKTSCGVAYAHGLPDYNGHYGIREVCDICPIDQRERCAANHVAPLLSRAQEMAKEVGLDPSTVSIDDRRIEVESSTEQQRYFMQHAMNYQVHDKAHPHHYRRHGRSDIGWS